MQRPSLPSLQSASDLQPSGDEPVPGATVRFVHATPFATLDGAQTPPVGSVRVSTGAAEAVAVAVTVALGATEPTGPLGAGPSVAVDRHAPTIITRPRTHAMRFMRRIYANPWGVGKWVAALFVVSACSAAARPPESYLTSARLRRAALEASVVDPHNGYSRLRLAEYGKGWDDLPEWNPNALPISAGARRGDPEALRALGEAAFVRYPLQIIPALRTAMGDPARYGLRDVVRVDHDYSVTCATCHTRGEQVGVGNDRLELGNVYIDGGAMANDPARAANLRAWGPGRMDVSTLRGDEPLRIPDLRPIRFVVNLQQSGALVNRDVTTLAIRIETLIIVSSGETSRPPREIALGLATYLWSLGDQLPIRAPTSDTEIRGQAIFAERCSRCHAPPSYSGPPVRVDEVGTDPVAARSFDRGTGAYRVPSLRGVSTRGPLLHDASVPSLDAMFDAQRAAKGHTYGLDLEPPARRDLIDFVRTL